MEGGTQGTLLTSVCAMAAKDCRAARVHYDGAHANATAQVFRRTNGRSVRESIKFKSRRVGREWQNDAAWMTEEEQGRGFGSKSSNTTCMERDPSAHHLHIKATHRTTTLDW